MVKSVLTGWREAVAALMGDRNAVVPCPSCHAANLGAKDSTIYREAKLLFVDRYLSCPACGARRVIERVRIEKRP